jgi:hypothetical protein
MAAFLGSLRARQTADSLVLDAGYPGDRSRARRRAGTPVRPEAYSGRFAVLWRTAEGTRWRSYLPSTEKGARSAATGSEPRWPGSCEILVKLREIRGLSSW